MPRPPLPAAVHLARGNPSRRPLAQLIAAADRTLELRVPEMPADLPEAAQAEWKRITDELYRAGLSAELYRTPLELYCRAYADMRALRTQLDRTVTASGEPSWLLLTALRMAEKRVLELAREFGMTPASRTKVTHVGKDARVSDEAKADPIAALLQRPT